MKYTSRFRSGLIPSDNVTLRNRWDTFQILSEEDVAELLKDKEFRNWLELPDDVISLIFTKLGLIQILYRAQFVCRLWQSLSKQPHLFRSIDLRKPFIHNFNYETVANIAIDRSSGQLEEIYMENFATDDLLQKISDKSISLNHICLVACKEISGEMLVEFVRKTPSIEHLELINCYFLKEVIEEIGICCCQLKKFRLNYFGYDGNRLTLDNEEAFTIANNMRGLCSLHLFGNWMTNEGLDAILDGCKHLEYLDLRCCCYIDFYSDDEMEEKCVERIKHLRRPYDCYSDFEYNYARMKATIIMKSRIFLIILMPTISMMITRF